ncbi:9563_t:CDS:10 [Funneliformis caledonium]|uniref:9563_t:CDS:1 n=1 Tax=Funneliformis caledonium TaxID=1117310 RepID=A0A9N8VBG8_9GLOM|nr:9563_t:CDS:10 [Funneliformis caledonium]
MGTTEKELTTRASYQNRDGFMILFPRKLQWTAKGENDPTIDIAISEMKSFFVGKPNVAAAKFRILCNQDITYTFVLTSQSAWDELNIIKARVTSGISRARSAAPSPAPQRSATTSPVHYRSTAPSPASGGSSPAVWNNGLQQNKNGATTNGRNGTTLPMRKVPSAMEINLRKNLLMRDKRLADQHRILVVEQKCIAEEEFWELRKNLLRDQDTRTSQQKGRSSTMPNLRPVTEEGGEAKINITPQLIHEIFEEYPRVKTAYDENITEELFWTRYVQSKFNDRNRAKATTSIASDDIFDKCWAETEEEREHGRKRLKISNLRDLNATKEDHMEIDFAPDITMRPGQGKILSLLRRNNRHGERILESACENSRRHKEMTSQQQKKEVYTEDIVMEDLIEEESLRTFKLDITDQREYFASQTAEIDNDVEMVGSEQSSIKHQGSTELLNKFQESFAKWYPNLKMHSLLETPILNSVTKKCNEIIKDKQIRMSESKPKIEHLPQKIEKEVNIIQLMGYEFLRHFWASVGSASKEKVEKNKRMTEQLKSVLEKIDQISELQPDDDYKQGFNLQNGAPDINAIQKGQRSDREEQRSTVNGKRLKIGSRISSGQVGGNRLNSNGSPKTDVNFEWYDAIIQAIQMLEPLRKAINKAIAHDQQSTSPNISRTVNRQARQSTNQSFQKSIVRELKQANPDHHRAISRESKTTSSPDIQRPMPRDTKQPQHHGMQKSVNREAKQITSPKIQRISNHDMQQSISPDVQRQPNRQIKQSANMRQENSRVGPKVSVRSNTQVQNARPDIDREAASARTTIKIPKKNVQQNVSRDDWQSNGRETHQNTNRVVPKNSIVASRGSSGGSSGSSAQVSSANKIKNSTKRKR